MFEILSKNDAYQKASYENCEQRLHMFFSFIFTILNLTTSR